MYRVQYCDPITYRLVTRYFKSISAIKRYIRKFNCPINFSVLSAFSEDVFYFHYDVKEDFIYGTLIPEEDDENID